VLRCCRNTFIHVADGHVHARKLQRRPLSVPRDMRLNRETPDTQAWLSLASSPCRGNGSPARTGSPQSEAFEDFFTDPYSAIAHPHLLAANDEAWPLQTLQSLNFEPYRNHEWLSATSAQCQFSAEAWAYPAPFDLAPAAASTSPVWQEATGGAVLNLANHL